MKAAIASVLLVSTQGAPLPGERDLSGYTFEDYVTEFGKHYNGLFEKSTRQAIFEDNMQQIKEHNAIEDKSWFVTVNKFTDMTNEEFRKMTKGRKEIPTELTQAFEPAENVEIADRLDWRETDGIVTPVKDQGGCGSCWAFSATETFESHLALATNSKAQILSSQQIVSCSKNPKHCGGTGGCGGSTQPLAFQYTETAGLTTETNYGYQGTTGTCQQDKIKPVGFNSGLTQLEVNNYTQLMQAVQKGPIAISLDGMGFLTSQAYGGGVVNCGNSWDMNHAVQLVGYGTDSGKDYWLVRNSWGSWGESGYIRLQRFGEGKEPCGMDETPQDGDACEGDTKPRKYCGSCAILSGSSYPTGMRKAEIVV